MSRVLLDKHCQRLIGRHGGIRKAARSLEISAMYLLRMAEGTYTEPSSKVLSKLGIEKIYIEVPTMSRTKHHRHQKNHHGNEDLWSRRLSGAPPYSPYWRYRTTRHERAMQRQLIHREKSADYYLSATGFH